MHFSNMKATFIGMPLQDRMVVPFSDDNMSCLMAECNTRLTGVDCVK